MESDFKGKTALVTGAGAGIGRDLVKRLVELGAKVVAVSQTQTNLDSLKAECGSQLETVCVNLASWEDTQAQLSEICKNVDYLVNNAGCGHLMPVDDLELSQVDKLIDVNLKAPMQLVMMVSQGMKARKFGSIVNVSSVASLAACDDHLVYAATKAGLDMATRIQAKELGPFNIRVNSVNPTVVWTKMGQEFWSEPTKQKALLAKIPMNRFVQVKEVVDPIVFLLSSQSGMVSGIVLPIDGGYSAC